MLPFLAFATAGCAAQDVSQAPPPPPPTSCSISTTPLPPSDATVTVDVAQKFQTIDGFGTSEHLFDDPHLTKTFNQATQRGAVVVPPDQQAAIFGALYTDIGLTRVRYATENGVEPVNDNADPDVTDLTMFNFGWKLLDGHVDYVRAARPLGVTTWYGAPIYPEAWMSRTNPAEFAEWSLASIRRWRDMGMTLPYWSVANEPGYEGGGVRLPPAFMRDAVKLIGARLAAEGIPTRLVIPDDVNPASALAQAQTILADPAARQYVAAIAFHVYDAVNPPLNPNFNSLAQLSALAKQYQLPLWMSEWYTTDWFIWAKTMDTLLRDYNVSAIDYAWGFFGAWDRAQLIVIQSVGDTYSGFYRTKQFSVMGQYSAFVRPGTVRVAADAANDPAIRVSAYFDGTRIVVVVLNVSSSDKVVRLELGAGIPCVRLMNAVRTSPFESGRVLPTVALDAPHVVTTMPAMSITTFVAQ